MQVQLLSTVFLVHLLLLMLSLNNVSYSYFTLNNILCLRGFISFLRGKWLNKNSNRTKFYGLVNRNKPNIQMRNFISIIGRVSLKLAKPLAKPLNTLNLGSVHPLYCKFQADFFRKFSSFYVECCGSLIRKFKNIHGNKNVTTAYLHN